MVTPDGMGADRYNERENMRAARQERFPPAWELAALDADGNELYRTGYFELEEDAIAEALDLSEDVPDNIPDEVASFEAVETEE